MVPKVDHFVPLLREVARLDSASYEARGAIYDRALSELLDRLRTTVPSCSEADIDRELLAFRAAVRRVEFGDMDEQDRVARQAIAERAQYLASRREARASAGPPAGPAPPAFEMPETLEPPAPAPAVAELVTMRRRRSVVGRLAGRMILAMALVALGLAGYAYEAGQIDASLLKQVLPAAWLAQGGGTTEPIEAVTYYDQAASGAPWRELAGSARWRVRTEDASTASGKAVLALDLRVPERRLSMSMTIRHEAAEDTAISHLLEFMFTNQQGAALDSVSSVTGITMKPVDGTSSRALAGLSIKAAPGLLLFGLSAEKDDAPRNAEALKTLSRFNISISFADGSTAVISVNKGASGADAFAVALADWAADRRSAAAGDQRRSELLSQGALWMRSGSLDRR